MSKKTFIRYDNLETLERIKRWPSLLKRFPRVRIYSAEHHAYWRGTGQGYTDHPQASTVMNIEEAFAKTRHCGPEKRIRFIEATLSPLEKENVRLTRKNKALIEAVEAGNDKLRIADDENCWLYAAIGKAAGCVKNSCYCKCFRCKEVDPKVKKGNE